MQVFLYGEDPDTWVGAFHQAALATKIEDFPMGIEPTRLRYLELSFLQKAAPQVTFISAEDSLASVRMRKDDFEISCMRRAVEIAQNALQTTLPSIKAGVTEQEIASQLTLQLLRSGSDPEFPFSPIVSGGPNSANPHATPSKRALEEGDLLVIDWGASYNGYISDLTRTFAIGAVDAELEKIADIVHQANAAGRTAARPGISASEVDRAARAVIEKAGYGKYFIHRTGHGVGMEAHEPPYIRAGNLLGLDVGMTFTIEPGIYLPDRAGVRIEDNVAITTGGADSLSDLPRELIRL